MITNDDTQKEKIIISSFDDDKDVSVGKSSDF